MARKGSATHLKTKECKRLDRRQPVDEVRGVSKDSAGAPPAVSVAVDSPLGKNAGNRATESGCQRYYFALF